MGNERSKNYKKTLPYRKSVAEAYTRLKERCERTNTPMPSVGKAAQSIGVAPATLIRCCEDFKVEMIVAKTSGDTPLQNAVT